MQLVHVNHGTVVSLGGREYEADPETFIFDVPEGVGTELLKFPAVWRTPDELAAEEEARRDADTTLASLRAEVEDLRKQLDKAKAAPAKPAAQRARK